MGTAGYAVAEAKVPYIKKKKTSRMKRWVRNWLSDSQDEVNQFDHVSTAPDVPRGLIGRSGPAEFDAEGLNITIHNANGGYVASFRRYDRKTDRHSNQLYVITSDQKFEEALAQCIAMECLSR